MPICPINRGITSPQAPRRHQARRLRRPPLCHPMLRQAQNQELPLTNRPPPTPQRRHRRRQPTGILHRRPRIPPRPRSPPQPLMQAPSHPQNLSLHGPHGPHVRRHEREAPGLAAADSQSRSCTDARVRVSEWVDEARRRRRQRRRAGGDAACKGQVRTGPAVRFPVRR